MKIRTLIGLVVMVIGVLLAAYGGYLTATEAPTSSIPRVFGYDVVFILVGAVVFVEGVVIQGFKNIYALAAHLAALIPYYLAIMRVQSLAQASVANSQTYVNETIVYWAIGIVLNVVGVILNRVKRKEREAPAQQTQQEQTAQPKPGP